jgi:cytochrome c oxidase cbb3-type subunit 4
MKESFADGWLGLVGLLFFVCFFAAVLVWLFRPGAKKEFKDYGDIPLKDDGDE